MPPPPVFVTPGRHSYLFGWQHKRPRAQQDGVWTPPMDTTITWMQNAAGRECWPVTDAGVKRVVDAFCADVVLV